MKKIIISLFLIVIFNLSFNSNEVVIPEKSIRYRIVANSNSDIDNYNKLRANEIVFPIINNIMNNSNSIEETRNNIKKNIFNIEQKLNSLGLKYNISFGQNYFPSKIYLDTNYESGNYESLVIYLDDAKGDNFWCVMFPPLCLIDIKSQNLDKLEYKSYVKEIINKYSN